MQIFFKKIIYFNENSFKSFIFNGLPAALDVAIPDFHLICYAPDRASSSGKLKWPGNNPVLMKERHEKQYAGVCLDNNHAIIIAVGDDKEAGIYDIQDKLKIHDNGGGGSEHSMNNARQADTAKYFKTISASLLPYDEILLFGPGKSQEQFHNFLKDDAQFNTKQITVDSAGHLTDPQMIAKVRDFFKS